MKILIISLARTGSTSFLKDISKKFNLKPITEPFNIKSEDFVEYNNCNWQQMDSICVKTHINHKDLDFYINFVNFFDKVYLLSRKNLKLCAESLSYANYYNMYSEEYNWRPTPNLKNTIEFVYECDDKLKTLSNLINKEIIYYEDIFDMESNERLRKHKNKTKSII